MISPRQLRADHAAIAWMNAFIASGKEEHRRVLFRTLSVEFFPAGVQFVGCDGFVLFRTWCSYFPSESIRPSMPEPYELPDAQVVVSDPDKFAIGFMRALLAAVDDESPATLVMSVEPLERPEEPVLGDELRRHALILAALQQKLSCPLFEDEFPNWRKLQFGLEPAERVSGMSMGTNAFAAIGKLRGVSGVTCKFRGRDRVIEFSGMDDDAPIRGLLMPMRRSGKEE